LNFNKQKINSMFKNFFKSDFDFFFFFKVFFGSILILKEFFFFPKFDNPIMITIITILVYKVLHKNGQNYKRFQLSNNIFELYWYWSGVEILNFFFFFFFFFFFEIFPSPSSYSSNL